MSLKRWSRSFLAVVLVAACGGDSTGPDDDDDLLGEFSAQVTGDVSRTFTGNALFGTGIEGETGFGLVLSDAAGANVLAVFGAAGGRPGTGTHTLGDAQAAMFGELIVTLQGTEVDFFISETGTLNVTSSSNSRLQGSITFHGVNGSGGEVDVTANFSAVCYTATAGQCN